MLVVEAVVVDRCTAHHQETGLAPMIRAGATLRRQREAAVDEGVLTGQEQVRAEDMGVLDLGDAGRTPLVPGRRRILVGRCATAELDACHRC